MKKVKKASFPVTRKKAAIVHQPAAQLYEVAVTEYRLLPPRLKAQLPDARQLKEVVATVEVPDAG